MAEANLLRQIVHLHILSPNMRELFYSARIRPPVFSNSCTLLHQALPIRKKTVKVNGLQVNARTDPCGYNLHTTPPSYLAAVVRKVRAIFHYRAFYAVHGVIHTINQRTRLFFSVRLDQNLPQRCFRFP